MEHLIGRMLTDADGESQGRILNAWVHQLEDACRHNNKSAADQCYYIAEYLTERTADWLKELLKSYEFHKDSAKDKLLELDRLHKRELEARERLRVIERSIEALESDK